MFICTDGSIYGSKTILLVDGLDGKPVGMFKAELATRVCDLLNRHGLTDCDTSSLADAILDLEKRKP